MASSVRPINIKIGDKDTEFVIEEVNGLKYCVFPTGTVLFRGDIYHTTAFGDRPLYLATNLEDAYQYGDVYQITLDKEYKLLNLNDKDTMNVIYDTASRDIKQILEKQYGYKSGKRNSDITRDNEFSKHLSKQNYDGYYLNEMPTDTGRAHPEIMICHPTRLTIGEMIKRLSELDRDAIINRREGEQLEARRREEKTKRRANIYDSDEEEGSERKGGLFGDDSDEESYSSPKKIPKITYGLMSSPINTEGGGGLFGQSNYSPPSSPVSKLKFGGKKSRKIRHRKSRKIIPRKSKARKSKARKMKSARR